MVFPLFSILPLFLNLPVGLAVGGITLAAGALWHFKGLPSLVQILLSGKTWLAVAAIIGVVAFMHAGTTIQNRQQEVATAKAVISTQKAVITSQQDNVVVSRSIDKKLEHNQQIAKQILQVIEVAPDGSQQDAVWDAIIDEEHSNGK